MVKQPIYSRKSKKIWRHHLLYDAAIKFFLTRKCQKTRKIQVLILNEKISISSEQLEELQWNFHERCDLILKVTKKQDFTLSLEYINLEKVTTTVKIWSKRNYSKISDFLILGVGQSFCLSSLLSFLNIKLQQLSKLEVRERFQRYPSFLFWVQGKIEDSETSINFLFFL